MYCLYICPFIFLFFLYQHFVFLIPVRTPSMVTAEAHRPHCGSSWHTACIPLHHSLPTLSHCVLLHSHHSSPTLLHSVLLHSQAPGTLQSGHTPLSVLHSRAPVTRHPPVCIPLSGLLPCICCQHVSVCLAFSIFASHFLILSMFYANTL